MKKTAPFQVEDTERRTINVVLGASDEKSEKIIEKIRMTALKDGYVLVYSDRRVWRHRQAEVNEDSPGLGVDPFIWHEDGNRVRCAWVEFTQDIETQAITERIVRRVWVDYDKVV